MSAPAGRRRLRRWNSWKALSVSRRWLWSGYSLATIRKNHPALTRSCRRRSSPAGTLAQMLSRRRRRSSSSAPAAPLDVENLLEEVLLRLAPQPSTLPRASLVCKRWGSILSNNQFLARFRKHHKKPPLLGFFVQDYGPKLVFTPVLDPPNHIPPARFSVPRSPRPSKQWRFVDCRHGLAILIDDSQHEVLVWDPITGQQHRVPFPPELPDNDRGSGWRFHAAVLCEDSYVVHGDRSFSPFRLALISGGRTKAFACLYDSTSHTWGNIPSAATNNGVILSIKPSILIGNSVYWLLFRGDILMFDIERQTLGMIDKPTDAHITDYLSFQLLRADNGSSGLVFAHLSDLSIRLWEGKINSNGVATWVMQQRNIQLDGLFPQAIVGYDEDSNVVVLATPTGDFILQLESMQFRKISESRGCWNIMIHYPYSNFYTSGSISASTT